MVSKFEKVKAHKVRILSGLGEKGWRNPFFHRYFIFFIQKNEQGNKNDNFLAEFKVSSLFSSPGNIDSMISECIAWYEWRGIAAN